MPQPPTTTLSQPRSRWRSCVYAYLSRSTVGCGLQGRALENRFPATSFISLHWFMAGSVELLSIDDRQAPPALRQPLPRRLLSGKSRPIVSRNVGDIAYFGVSMYPDAFTAAFGIAPSVLEGRFADADQLLAPAGVALFDAVAAAPTHEARIAVFEAYLAEHAGGFRVSLWNDALRAGSQVSVGLMSSLLKVGNRQTIRATRQVLGVRVADLKKFARGEAAFGELQARQEAAEPVSLADIAAQAGYADQSHLSRECKAVTGMTPRQFMRDFEGDESVWIYRATSKIRRD
jgi:AraC-like DNA-binding protein